MAPWTDDHNDDYDSYDYDNENDDTDNNSDATGDNDDCHVDWDNDDNEDDIDDLGDVYYHCIWNSVKVIIGSNDNNFHWYLNNSSYK